MKYILEYTSAIEPHEIEEFDTEEDFRYRFRHAHPMFELFIEDEEIDMMHVIVETDSYKLRRIYT